MSIERHSEELYHIELLKIKSLSCVKCGQAGEDVERTRDPYLYDMTGEEVYADYCLDCLEDMRGNI